MFNRWFNCLFNWSNWYRYSRCPKYCDDRNCGSQLRYLLSLVCYQWLILCFIFTASGLTWVCVISFILSHLADHSIRGIGGGCGYILVTSPFCSFFLFLSLFTLCILVVCYLELSIRFFSFVCLIGSRQSRDKYSKVIHIIKNGDSAIRPRTRIRRNAPKCQFN